MADEIITLMEPFRLPRGKKFRTKFNKQTICRVTAVIYDEELHEAKMLMPAHDQPDKTGTIKMFQEIDPDVQSIVTYNQIAEGRYLGNIRYVKERDAWKSYRFVEGSRDRAGRTNAAGAAK